LYLVSKYVYLFLSAWDESQDDDGGGGGVKNRKQTTTKNLKEKISYKHKIKKHGSIVFKYKFLQKLKRKKDEGYIHSK